MAAATNGEAAGRRQTTSSTVDALQDISIVCAPLKKIEVKSLNNLFSFNLSSPNLIYPRMNRRLRCGWTRFLYSTLDPFAMREFWIPTRSCPSRRPAACRHVLERATHALK